MRVWPGVYEAFPPKLSYAPWTSIPMALKVQASPLLFALLVVLQLVSNYSTMVTDLRRSGSDEPAWHVAVQSPQSSG